MRGIQKFVAQMSVALVAVFVLSMVFVGKANAATFTGRVCSQDKYTL